MKAGVISLGCSKNRVDTELLLGALRGHGLDIIAAPKEADVLIVNTCGFIEPAKQESIDTILEMALYKKTGRCRLLVVCGCLSQRYPDELATEMPEVDILWGVKDQTGLAAEIAGRLGLQACRGQEASRVLTTPFYSAYLRIADGCDNRCAYCAIPLIRGARVSVPTETLLEQARALAEGGVRELTLIAQDTSAYGLDLYGKPMLAKLMRELAGIEKLHWIRVLYSYPNTVSQELIDTMLGEPKLLHYIDMPIQHIDDDMLHSMNRHGSSAHIQAAIRYIRESAPDFILRTTVMVGFPGETEERFDRLAEFMRFAEFDRVGAFAYSREDGTPAAEFLGQLPEDVKQARLDLIMGEQRDISRKLNQRRIGKTYEVLTERVTEGFGYGRSYAEAPEVDGTIRFRRTGRPLAAGDFTQVRISSAGDYDLTGEEL